MPPSTTKQTGDQMQQLQWKKANYGNKIKVNLEDAQEETKEEMVAEEFQYNQKENMTTSEYQEYFNHAIRVEEEAWQEEDTDDRQGWETVLEEEDEKMHNN
eukprot:4677446-Ditylum_brightwellii.AAC.1